MTENSSATSKTIGSSAKSSAKEALLGLSAGDAAAQLREGSLKATELAEAYLARIQAVDPDVQAWAHLDVGFVLRQAEAADKRKQHGLPLGPLHGLPVALKDNIDTRDLPTENGTVLQSGRRPFEDATLVSVLKAAGAIVLGKTVSTELAVFGPGKTRNPHNADHTPGGSSSGSAAAVAAYMAPLAIGTQTNGSVVRPASYCGVYGYKPSFGLISRKGVLPGSGHFDTVGVFGRSVEDCALLGQTLMQFDAADPAMTAQAPPPLLRVASETPPVTPRLAFVPSPFWDRAEDYTKEAFEELAALLDDTCVQVELGDAYGEADLHHRRIMVADLAKNLNPFYEKGRDQLTQTLRDMIEEGHKVTALDYNRGLDRRKALRNGMDELFENFDAILTPATPGQALKGLGKTGDPIFSTLWTFCGLPCITLPLLQGPDGLPLGVQLVASRGDDARLLRVARWLAKTVDAAVTDNEKPE